MATDLRRFGVLRGRRWVRALTLAGVAAAGPAAGQPPAKLPPAVTGAGATTPLPAAQPDPGRRVVAFVHGNVPIGRDELGEFLIARGGFDKLELLVNRKVIEIEAARRGITVTPEEVLSAFNDEMNESRLGRDDHIKMLAQRYGKTLPEWTADVTRPRLILGKMCRDRVKVADDEVRRAYEHRYGERREARLIIWPKGPKIPLLGQDVKATVLASEVEFDKLASAQPNELLARAIPSGAIAAVGRHLEGEDPAVVAAIFELKPGETKWVETETTSTCVKCLKLIPPDAAVTFEKARGQIEKEVFDKKLTAEIPNYFAGLKQQANPQLTVNVPLPPTPLGPDGKPATGADGKPIPAPPRAPTGDPRVLAFVYNTMPVTREDLGEFLIARGGYERLDLMVNRKIIDLECARRGVAATPEEVEAALVETLKGMPGVYNLRPGMTPDQAVKQMKADFVQQVLPRHRMTMWEYTEDVVKPRLLLAKMCRDRVKVTEDELKKSFEHHYGEKRAAKLIIWPKGEFRTAQKQWDEARKGDAQFDSVARAQRDPNLASRAGDVTPVGRHSNAEVQVFEQLLFTLKEGEVSQLFETPAGIACVKYVKLIPPDPTVTLEKVRPGLEREVFELKLSKEIPNFFGELRQAANPNLLLKGPPSDREVLQENLNLIQQAGGPPPGVAPKK